METGEESVVVTAKMKRKVVEGIEGYTCNLPIPFVKGYPADITVLTQDELRSLIKFAYRSAFKADLPSVRSNQKPPSWWPVTVTFDKYLKVIMVSGSKTPMVQRRELVNLIEAFYGALGLKVLLRLAQVLADDEDESIKLVPGRRDEPWHVVTRGDKTILMVDVLTRTYDLNERDQRATKEEENYVPPGYVAKGKGKGGQYSKSTKRRLFDVERAAEESHTCRFCRKVFKLAEFCEDHEGECMKGPRGNITQSGFMNALGMKNIADVEENEPLPSTSRSLSDVTVPIESKKPQKRALRTLPKRNQLVAMVKNNPIPITSERGQRLIKDMGEKVKHSYPPPYERNCESRKVNSSRGGNFPNVAKKMIEKHGQYPHIYTYGRRQRALRDQELAIGLSARSFKLLNQCKKPKLVIEKIKPVKHTVKLPPQKVENRRCYLYSKMEAAIKLPKVCLMDIRKHPSPEVAKYLKKKSFKSVPIKTNHK